MNKREFVVSMLVAAAGPATAQAQAARTSSTPALLTITGAVGRTNRPPYDAASDLLFSKHAAKFTDAYALEWRDLAGLPARTIVPTLEYDNKPHRLRGPLLTDVLELAGARASGASKLTLRAVDGYAPVVTWDDARKVAFIVATHLDDQPMALGGLGPLWAVFEADRFPEFAAKPVTERFASCPWALYHVEVAQA